MKKCEKLSLVRVSLFTIRQKEHKGDTVLSKAFILLFSGRELFLKRKRKFLKSLQMNDLFQFPKQTIRIVALGTGRSTRFEYCITVRRFSGFADSLLLLYKILLNCLEPFSFFAKKFTIELDKLSESSAFFNSCLEWRRTA